MQREIKFKFWLGHTKKMTYAHTLEEVGKIIPEFSDDIIALQYTGLKDKNGKEIYEGDIIEYRVSEKLYSMYNKRRCIAKATIEYIDDAFKTMEFYNEKGYRFQSGYWWQSCEVIGNIYENSSLINPEK